MLEAKFFLEKFDYKMVHSEVYLNKYVVGIAPFDLYTCLAWLLSKYNINIIMSSMTPPTASLFRSSGELVWPCETVNYPSLDLW